MRIVQTSAPTHEPILLEEVKAYLRIDSDLEDAEISSFIAAARALVESATGLSLVDRSIDIYADSWSGLMFQGMAGSNTDNTADIMVPSIHAASSLRLPVRPVSAINAIALIDASGAETNWAVSNYRLQPGMEPTLRLASGANWPALSRAYDAIKISVTAGFGPDWNAVPELIQQATIKAASKLYLTRGVDTMDSGNLLKESGAAGLLHSFRKVRL